MLTSAFQRLKEWTVPLSEIAKVGPDSRGTRGAYRRTDWPTGDGRRALWYHKTGVTQSMRAQTDSYIEPKPGKEQAADKQWDQRSRLFLPYKLRIDIGHAAAVVLDEPALASIWIPCHPKDRETEMALCAYLNSSIGFLAMLAERDNKILNYPSMSLDTLRALRVPDFRDRAEARDSLADACDRLKDATLAPFPQMAEDPVRRELDDAVCAALSLDPEWVALVRSELAREPSVTGKRYAP